MSEHSSTEQRCPECHGFSMPAGEPCWRCDGDGVIAKAEGPILNGEHQRLTVVPMTLRAARQYVTERHRHHKAPQGGLFAVGARLGADIVGCAIVGKPVARMLNDGRTVEITRLCTDGTRNACSFLYRVCVRVARSMGYDRVLTYTLDSESGASLRGAGFRLTHKTKAESWSRPSRGRTDKHPTQHKFRWEAAA